MTAEVAPRDAPPLTKTEARTLTDRIRTATETLWDLLLEAKDRQAWAALGYDNFESYAGEEFGISRSHAYRLVGQGEVMRELTAAAGLSPMGDDSTTLVSERAARDLKPVLPAVVAEVKERVKGVRKASRPAIVGQVVEEARSVVAKPLPAHTSVQSPTGDSDRVAQAAAVIPRLVKLDPAAVAAALGAPGERGRLAEALRKWAVAVEAEAKGYAKTQRDANRAVATAAAAGNGKCSHPTGRRLGSTCMVCMTTLK